MEWTYCPYCATKLTIIGPHVADCAGCERRLYDNPKSTAGIVLLDKDNKVVLCVRGEEPQKGKLDTIGGFIEAGESIEEGLYRELFEETGLNRDDITVPQYISGEATSYLFRGVTHSLSWLVFAARIKNDRMTANDDISGFERLEIGDLPLDRFCTPEVMGKIMTSCYDYFRQQEIN